MRYWILLTAALTAGCMSMDDGGGAMERRVSYSCDRGPGVMVVYTGDSARIESADGQSVTLTQRPAGSGFWYESATHSIRGKGDEITYTVGRMAPMTCTAS